MTFFGPEVILQILRVLSILCYKELFFKDGNKRPLKNKAGIIS